MSCSPFPCFEDGTALLTDGTEPHLASLRFVNTTIALDGQDHPALAALKDEFADIMLGPPPGLPPDRVIELALETGSRPTPRTRPIKRLSAGELAELRRQLRDPASVVFERTSDGSLRVCCDCRDLDALTEPLVEPLPHIDAPQEEKRGARWFTNFDPAQGYHQVRLREADRRTGGRPASAPSWASSGGT